jgi:dTDP-4-dehydrorhamnose 3,5-epimerase
MKTQEINQISGNIAIDDRGSLRFINDFNFEGVKRFYQVQNHCKNFIRAWHGHIKEAKYVYLALFQCLQILIQTNLDKT